MLVIAYERLLNAKTRQEFRRHPRIFAKNCVYAFERLNRPQSNIAQIANGCRHHEKRPRHIVYSINKAKKWQTWLWYTLIAKF